ncbi:uncharacterized protein LOC122500150 [Leptopilina heterotoma]|uniref:uncharacterized protein LOC122500150 n=1 Tax=Leptopilina heterotoma TaxID=63436 RepID=UPI001CA7EC6C|nr:uncharacterized protein LOC122500150 [Leptopilina heterotoma]XP_043464859.1 uncharacterized protein LOC122500150 [Leptopilina heterotoma]XP_043464860.1 uncharacterized protein LOC122500150 [Leptopilina heterotoma]XP_043464861.1 uncharacterized protein LOC122500150 [Leptopilina heterotoma]XP_043464862.1 uncharacterized protein LOC122500150 [Leptopilina heterotoma]
MMLKELTILVLWACVLSISTAVAPNNNQVAKYDDSNKIDNSDSSRKDMQKAGDKNGDASKLEVPASPIINPVEKFIRREIAKKENLALWLALETMSYGSGATAKSISEGMQLAINGMTQLFTDIGLPAANTAEKLSLLSDQKAKSRSKRSISSAIGTLYSGVTQLIKFPFILIKGIFLLPFRIVYYTLRWPFSFIFGGDSSTYTLLLTDMSTERITHMVLTAVWKFMRDTGFAQLNTFATKLKDNNGVPTQFRTLLSEYAAIYSVMKMLKYVS